VAKSAGHSHLSGAGASITAKSAGVVDALHFGGDEKDGGISRRRGVIADVGIDAGPDGRPAMVLTLNF
jgi:hypothetical protein